MDTIQVVEKDGIYSCDIGITKEEWLSILQDKGTLLSFKDALLRFFYMPEHKGTCTSVSNVMGKKPGALNILISKFGSFVQKKLGNRFEVLGTDGKPTRWIIPMGKGKGLSNSGEGTFEWTLRPELVEAIEDYLYWYLVEQYKELRKIQPINVKGNGDELYKWQLITASIGKTPLEILSNHVAHSNTTSKGGFANLISFQNNKALKYLAESNRDTAEIILARLTNETMPLNARLADYKSALMKIIPNEGYPNKAYDERTAATILTCFNPDKYTFYKREGVYDYLCKYLGVNIKKSGESYAHYLSLLEPLANLAEEDDELQSIVKPMLEEVRHSKLLLAQDIIWKLIGSDNAKRLGYIYDLLFNTDKNMDNSKIDEYIELLKSNHNLIFTGAPGTGKTYLAKQMAAKLVGVKDIEELKGNKQFGFVQFHPSYDYTDFVEGLRPRNEDNENVGFERKDGVFKEFCIRALKDDETKPFVFVIDEINRGEMSKIFGELFFSIDPDYRGEKGQTRIQYANMVSSPNEFDIALEATEYGHFFVPKNVYIIGTMNDIDRSVESMDFAMRRRFAWNEVTAKESYYNMIEANQDFTTDIKEAIKQRMFSLNEAILDKALGLGQEYQVGAAYFRNYLKYEGQDAFECLWKYHLKGLLSEYLRGNADVKGALDKLENAYNLKNGTDKNNGQQLDNTPSTDGNGEDRTSF